jgi:hypothetical protein
VTSPAARVTERIARACVAARLRTEQAPSVVADRVSADWRAAAALCDRWLLDASDPGVGEDEVVNALDGVGR